MKKFIHGVSSFKTYKNAWRMFSRVIPKENNDIMIHKQSLSYRSLFEQ